MFTLDHTFEEIMKTEPVGRAIGGLFPACWLERIPAHHFGHTMRQIAQEDTMDWGAPFVSEAFLECANMLSDIAESRRFQFIPLWQEQAAEHALSGWKDGIPDADTNTEDGVWLMTANPEVDNLAFAHTAGQGSVPPYESTAVSPERRDHTGIRPAVIVCPGGGYAMHATQSEGIQVAQRMERDGGFKAFLLNYRITPNYYPLPQMDLALAVMHVRAHAARYRIDPDRILIMGSSAGGHLCASEAYLHEVLKEHVLARLAALGTASARYRQYESVSARPDALGLLYPVISFLSEYHEGSYLFLTNEQEGLRELLSVEQHITSDYPPTYAFTNADDTCVPPSNTARLDQALTAAGVKHLCQTYPTGEHGVGLGYECSCKRWSEEMLAFMTDIM